MHATRASEQAFPVLRQGERVVTTPRQSRGFKFVSSQGFEGHIK